jgi:hypothetical protein
LGAAVSARGNWHGHCFLQVKTRGGVIHANRREETK